MNRVEKIWQELSIQPQEVKLNALRDFELGVFDFPSAVSAVEQEIEVFARKMQSEINTLDRQADVLDKAYKELKQKADELGIPISDIVTSSSVDMYQQAKKQLNKFQPVIKALKKV